MKTRPPRRSAAFDAFRAKLAETSKLRKDLGGSYEPDSLTTQKYLRHAGRVDANRNSIAVSNNTIYVGGDFTSIGGQQRSRIAAVDATTELATSWNPVADRPVRAISVSGSRIYVVGDFRSIGGSAVFGLAVFEP